MREREHGDENADGTGNAKHGDDGGGPAGTHAAHVVNKWDGHGQILLSAVMTRMRMALIPGINPLIMPTAKASANPEKRMMGESTRLGKSPLSAVASAGMDTIASSRPITPPMMAIISDSEITNRSTARSEKPMALNTASSPVRSRTEMAMVLPVTRRRVKKTTAPIERIRNWILPNCLTQ